MNNSITFKSTFRPVRTVEYREIAARIDKKFFVDFPWTIKESVKAAQAKTTNIYDCSVLGISDGKDVLLMHLCPTIKENEDFNKIKNFIMKKIKIDNPDLQAVLIGSQESQPGSKKLFDFLQSIMDKWNISTSIFNTCRDDVHVAYQSKTDEWIISSLEIDKLIKEDKLSSAEIFERSFEHVKLSSLDEFA